jgi:hypothetical protein
MKMADGHGVALCVESEGRNLRRVFEQLPVVCREPELGSPACLGELALTRDLVGGCRMGASAVNGRFRP